MINILNCVYICARLKSKRFENNQVEIQKHGSESFLVKKCKKILSER